MKILLLGSGALRIGQAGEFDYSGSQAIKTFVQAGHEVILINPNIATVQTDPAQFSAENCPSASKTYLLPVTPEVVTEIIKQERPDALTLSFGGQTALNCGLELEAQGILKKYKVPVLGTPVSTIRLTEDRQLFADELRRLKVLTPRSIAAYSLEEAEKALETIDFPVMVRAGFALGGQGSGFCHSLQEFRTLVREALAFSPQVLVEEDLRGWKEIEYEVVRDGADNAITVVNMENFDPLGIHTGESLVVSPSLTLNNFEYQNLRTVALKVIRHLGVVGECNIQYALNPHDPADYRVIEVNARLSRSSALASKAAGYPLAAVAASIMLGKTLPEIPNAITEQTKAFFEPALDYIAFKLPRWDLGKFRKVSHEITTEMKSVGEVMALGRNFPEVVQKGLRMLSVGSEGLLDSPFPYPDQKSIEQDIAVASPRRIWAIGQALFQETLTVEEIHQLSRIDHWFLQQLKRITDFGRVLKPQQQFSAENLQTAKKLGFSDKELGRLTAQSEEAVRAQRYAHQLFPVNKQIDTLAGEFPAQTNYLYTTYHGVVNDVATN